MSEKVTGLSPAEVAQTDGNLKLVSPFIQEYLNEPERFEPIPKGAAVILLPPEDQGDSELRRANVRMAESLIAEGRDVVFWTVGAQEPGKPQNLFRQAAAFQEG